MITVLVTGSNGQLGNCLQDISKKTTNINWVFKSSNDLNITDENSIDKAFKNNKIDYLVNCAAYTAVDKAENDKDKAFLVNAEGVKYLAIACKKYNVTLIHISTDFVFDGNKTTPYTETDEPNPINVYGASKYKGEQYVQEIVDEHFIIRTSWVYSKYGNNFVKTMLRLAETRDEISVVCDQIGTPTYAGDLALVILHIIETASKNYGLYHFSNLGETSWFDFANAIFDTSKTTIKLNSIKTEAYPTPAVRPIFSVLDKTKIKKTIDFSIPYWKDSLNTMINLYLKDR